MILARYRQQPYDIRRRNIDYTQWLADAETITEVTTDVTPVTDPPFTVASAAVDPDGKTVIYYAGGGVADTDYTIAIRTVTSLGPQKREDEIEVSVLEDA